MRAIFTGLLLLASQVVVGQFTGLIQVSGPASTTVTPPPSQTTTPPATYTDVVTVTVNYVNSPGTVKMTDLPGNKNLFYAYVADDGSVNVNKSLEAFFEGGVASDGNTYPGKFFDDGTGKRLSWGKTVALCWNNGQLTNPTSTTFHQTMLAKGRTDVSNHSLTHSSFYRREYDYQQNNINIHRAFGLRPTTFTIPVSFEGFVEPPLNAITPQGYKRYSLTASAGYGTSGASSDGNNVPLKPNVSTSQNVLITNKVKSNETRRLITTRWYYQDDWTTAQLTSNKTTVDNMFSIAKPDSAGSKWFVSGFSHGYGFGTKTFSVDTAAFNNWVRFFNYIETHAGADATWFGGIQEFSDYMTLKKTLLIGQTSTGKTQTITLNYSTLDPAIRWQNVSLIGGGAIASVSVQGADDFSYNPATGLINIYKQRRSFISPETDVNSPEPVGVTTYTSDSTKIAVKFDRPILQPSLTGWAVYNSPYTLKPTDRTPPSNLGTPIPITSITGSGTDWVIQLSGPVSVSTVVDYRQQQGSAVDASTGQLVNSVIGYPLTIQSSTPATSGQKTLSVVTYAGATSGPVVSINGVVQPGNQFTFPTGTLINSVSVSLPGKTITIAPYPTGTSTNTINTVLMDRDRVLRFYSNM